MASHPLVKPLLGLAVLVLVAGCDGSPTAVVLRVDSDLAPRTELLGVHVHVVRAVTQVLVHDQDYDLAHGRFTLPGEVAIVTGNTEDNGVLLVDVTGELGTTSLSRHLQVAFHPHATVYLDVFLARGCLGVVCGAGMSCGRGGCAPVAAVPDEPDAMDSGAEVPSSAVTDVPGDVPVDVPVAVPVDVPVAVPVDAGPAAVCSPGTSQACSTAMSSRAGVGVCRAGTRTCTTAGQWSTACVGEVVPSAEVCNGLDDDCNGTVDDVAACMMDGGTCLQVSPAAWACCHATHGNPHCDNPRHGCEARYPTCRQLDVGAQCCDH